MQSQQAVSLHMCNANTCKLHVRIQLGTTQQVYQREVYLVWTAPCTWLCTWLAGICAVLFASAMVAGSLAGLTAGWTCGATMARLVAGMIAQQTPATPLAASRVEVAAARQWRSSTDLCSQTTYIHQHSCIGTCSVEYCVLFRSRQQMPDQ